MCTPYALELYLTGKTAEELAKITGIPVEHIQARLDAAEQYLARQGAADARKEAVSTSS